MKMFYKELAEEEHEVIDTTETSPKKINPKKDTTLQVQISRNVDEGAQQNVDKRAHLHETIVNKSIKN